MKQIAAVEHGNNLHTLGQDVIVELFHLLVNRFERGAFFGPLAHQHAALDDVRLIHDDAVGTMIGSSPVSYTHLDVYKRQDPGNDHPLPVPR